MAFRAQWSNANQSSNISVVTSTIAGDALVAWAITDSATAETFTWPSGFTQVGNVLTNVHDGQSLGVAIKANATGSEGTLVLGTTQGGIGGIVAYSGRDTTQPDVTPVFASDTTAAGSPWTVTAGAMTTTTNGCDIVAVMGSDAYSMSGDVVHSFSDNLSGSWTVDQDIYDAGNNFLQGAVGSRSQTTAGAITVTGTGTLAGVNADRSIVVIALRGSGIPGPTINTQPASVTKAAGETATFTVSATASSGTLSYQWQVNTGGGFGNVAVGTGGTTSSYTTATLVEGDNGNQYRCNVTDSSSTIATSTATLTVPTTKLSFRNATNAGDSSFSLASLTPAVPAGTISGDLVVGFLLTINTGTAVTHTTPAGWTLIRSDTLPVVSGTYNARSSAFYKIAGGSEGSNYTFSASGNAAILAEVATYANPNPTTPYDTGSYMSGSGTSISLASVTAAEKNEMLVGFAYTDGGGASSSFSSSVLTERIDSGNGAVYDVLQAAAGASGAKVVTASITGAHFGYLLAFKSLSEVNAGPTINTQPSSTTKTAGATATFTVAATTSGGALSYQWKVNTGGGYANVSGGSGATTASYTTVATTVGMSGYLYRCDVTDSNGTKSSDGATLTVNPAPTGPTIDSQPSSQTVVQPAAATFTIAATTSGGAITYQWQVNTGGGFGSVSGGTGGTTNSYTTAATTVGDTGNTYRCLATDTNGTTTTNAVSLTVNATSSLKALLLSNYFGN